MKDSLFVWGFPLRASLMILKCGISALISNSIYKSVEIGAHYYYSNWSLLRVHIAYYGLSSIKYL